MQLELNMENNITNTIRIIGVYKLDHPLACNSDILGKSFKIKLDNIEGNILFPKLSPGFISAKAKGKLDNDDLSIPGPICPIDGSTLGNDEDSFGRTSWGQTLSFPEGNSLINQVLLEFYISENDLGIDSQTVYNHIEEWLNRFYDICEVLLIKPVKSKEEKTPTLVIGYGLSNTGFILHAIDPKTKKLNPIYNNNDRDASIKVESLKYSLNFDELTKIIDLTNEQRDLSFDFKYYLEGLRAFFDNDCKKAITVCSPALEASLLNGIKNFSASKNIYFLDKLLKKYRMLGGYFALATDIDMELPTQDYKIALLDLRNNVIHNGYAPTKEETEKYLKDVRLYLDTFSKGMLSE